MAVSDTIIREDVDNDEAGFNAFLATLNDDEPTKKKTAPSEEDDTQTEDTQQSDEDTQDDDDYGDESDGQDDEGEDDPDDPDNAEVEIKVGENVHKAKIKDLKRLYGQEAALTQRSQQLAAHIKAAEVANHRAVEATKVLLTRAEEQAKPYQYGPAEWALLAANMDPETYNALRVEAEKSQANVAFLRQELDGHMGKLQQEAQERTKAEANATLAAFKHPETGIPGFGPELYQSMVEYGVKSGIPDTGSVTSEPALRILWKAMQYDKSQKALKSAEGKVKKATDKPTKTLKPGAKRAPDDASRSVMDRLRKNGNDEDAAMDAFMVNIKRGR